ncbi:aminotransferase class I/II-fold pyridoxal phosphate-dependent enzyme [Paenibacillus spiritus]|uniref:Aminotransferase class I/II-fold pyridoxal phosphate-dependent enzyme n=1 Tax=Paenibacillus spiritus TaxID=2496557 RepID=A0A5J5FVA4_9BACL|nr:aminotransferase class I/II-fold pyridoxal phosphate-dependent enzyme [Paenibacillus spiritus]KAA8997560.1 aminotransferase class I/II-fold pyridoxal phosphate-dependent enzyme [Paenibacillus spiritus]
MTHSRILLSPPHMSGREQHYIQEAFETNWIAPLGPNVDAFEREVADYVGTRGAAALSSGTAAIHVALQLLGVGSGDVVFCSSMTFIASANPIVYQGAAPVFIDSEPESWNMSPAALERAFAEAKAEQRLPKAVIVVNLYGQSAKMNELTEICGRYGVPVVEDAAESLGTTYEGRPSGTFGRFGIFSFNGNKIITTSGGGMLVSDDPEALNRARFLATQARDAAPHYQHSVIGHNYRMSNLLAGVGRAQLEVLDSRVDARRAVFGRYQEALGREEGLRFMPELAGTRSNRWLTTLTFQGEGAAAKVHGVLNRLAEENIEARPLWKPLHLQPVFAGVKFYPHSDGVCVSEELFESGLCLPSGSSMSQSEQERVIEVVRRTLNESAGSLPSLRSV